MRQPLISKITQDVMYENPEFKQKITQRVMEKIEEGIELISAKELAEEWQTEFLDAFHIEDHVNLQKIGEMVQEKIMKNLEETWNKE